MTFRVSLFILFMCGMCVSSFAQVTLTGTVTDPDGQALPYVNIGVKKQNIGTTSLADGTFSIQIPIHKENDTLSFSMAGYGELNLPIKNIIAANQQIFQLEERATVLDPVTITGKKLVERNFGIRNNNTGVHFTDGSTNQNDIFEIAQLIKSDTIRSKITSVNLYINQSRSDSGTFRINFYGFDGSRPTERIIEKSIVQQKKIQEGWLKFDLTNCGVYLKGNFVVALEFIPTGSKNDPIYYEIKLGGSSKSFVRTSSHGAWNVPPHHYRLFITMLVSDEKHKAQPNEAEEKETIPSTTLFSESVRDSFFIFIHLPKDYAKKKHQKFPVIYLLDANVYFDMVAAALEENHVKAILVGIGYKDFLRMDSLRNRDYLYPKASFAEDLPISGGANAFLKFIEAELMPYIHQTYSADTTQQTLMGHSFGGYFVLYALLESMHQQTKTFENYVAASPSLDYSDKYLLNQFKHMTEHSSGPKDLFVTYGGKEDSEDGGTGTEGIDNFNLLVTLLSGSSFGNIRLKSEIYPAFGHMETPIPTFTKAVEEIK